MSAREYMAPEDGEGDGWIFDDVSVECEMCRGDGWDECPHPLECTRQHSPGGLCPCRYCGGSRASQRPEGMVSARELRAEARAWRRRARECDRWRLTMNGTTDMRGMQSRVLQHVLVAVFVANERDAPWTVDSRVLACLFLALECEDEAKEAAGG